MNYFDDFWHLLTFFVSVNIEVTMKSNELNEFKLKSNLFGQYLNMIFFSSQNNSVIPNEKIKKTTQTEHDVILQHMITKYEHNINVIESN